MPESEDDTDTATDWTAQMAAMNESFRRAVEQNVDAQTRFVNSWFEAVDDAWDTTPEHVADGMEGYANAYQAWMAAAEAQLDRTQDLLEGEDVPVEDFRDIWLNTANEAFKEVMGTSAFAAATGETLSEILDIQQQVNESAADTLHALGFATDGDIDEVGERLVELERRQHAIEEKLDRILDAVEVDEA